MISTTGYLALRVDMVLFQFSFEVFRSYVGVENGP